LVVGPLRRRGDRTPRHELADERHAAAQLASDQPLGVETKVHFFEALMIRNRQTADARLQELKADDGDERLIAPEIELGAGQHERRQKRRIGAVAQHREMPPLRRQERASLRAHIRYRTRMRSDRVMMNVLSVLKSRTSTAGFWGVIIVDSRSTGV